MRLIHQSTGNQVKPGETLTDFLGEEWRFIQASEPHKPQSTGRVAVRRNGKIQEFFPGVFDLCWEED